jgi:3-hydroxymyristoyl/3-hydroxydecanoyl-(acyl carrier protein) dehydratase
MAHGPYFERHFRDRAVLPGWTGAEIPFAEADIAVYLLHNTEQAW